MNMFSSPYLFNSFSCPLLHFGFDLILTAIIPSPCLLVPFSEYLCYSTHSLRSFNKVSFCQRLVVSYVFTRCRLDRWLMISVGTFDLVRASKEVSTFSNFLLCFKSGDLREMSSSGGIAWDNVCHLAQLLKAILFYGQHKWQCELRCTDTGAQVFVTEKSLVQKTHLKKIDAWFTSLQGCVYQLNKTG